MMNSKQLLFALLRDALWRRGEGELPRELTEKEAVKVLRRSEKQGVYGLAIDALVRNNIGLSSVDLLMDVLMDLDTIKQDHQIINQGLKELTELFQQYDVDYVVVKGQAVAAYYPTPVLRMVGDIDYYCDERNFSKSLQAIHEAWGIDTEGELQNRHIHYDYQETTYEGHIALTTFYSKRKNKYWQQLVDGDQKAEVTIDGVTVKTLSPQMHMLYVFMHLFSHLLGLGIGIRQFCDWAVLLHSCHQEIDWEQLRRDLKKLGMERAYRACSSIMTDYLGLPEEELGYVPTDGDRRYAKWMLDVMWYRGNMGLYNRKNGTEGWKHNMEALTIKVGHFLKFMPLAPGFCCRWMANEMGRKLFKH